MKTLAKALRKMSAKERFLYGMTLLVRLVASGLDMIGLALVGLAASLISGLSALPTGLAGQVLSFLEKAGFVNTYAVFGLFASVFFLAKALVSIWLNNAVSKFVAHLETSRAVNMFRQLTKASLDEIAGWSEKEINLALNEASYIAYNYSFVAGSIIFGESVLLLTVGIFLAAQDLVLFMIMAVYFGVFIAAIALVVNRRTESASRALTSGSLKTQTLVKDYLGLVRQFHVSGTSERFVEKFAETRYIRANSQAAMARVSYLPRYIVESALMFGVAIILWQRSLDGGTSIPAATVAIFLTGALRLIASLLPLQASFAALKTVDEGSRYAFDFDSATSVNTRSGASPSKFNNAQLPEIVIEDAAFSFGVDFKPVLDKVNFRIPFGSYVGIVGKSGAGKSTLTDLMIGLREPTNGLVRICGSEPRAFVAAHPGAVAYVPQQSHLLRGTLLENILMEIDPKAFDGSKLEDVLTKTKLSQLVESLPDGLETEVGDGVRDLSGGQLQRLSLARALYQNPKILLLDETTSALDQETKADIDSMIAELRGKMTVIEITHAGAKLPVFDMVLRVASGKVAIEKAAL